MKIENSVILSQTTHNTDIIDITSQVKEIILHSNICNGSIIVFISGSTAALTTIEYESGVISDFKKAIEKIAPSDIEYEHDRRWGDENGYSHVNRLYWGHL
ncbi:MAG: YjbQ family protein [Pseudomonadota bacterium]